MYSNYFKINYLIFIFYHDKINTKIKHIKILIQILLCGYVSKMYAYTFHLKAISEM